MVTAAKPNGSNNAAPTPAPTSAPLSPAANTLTGTFTGLKSPAVNGIAILLNGSLQSFTAAAAAGTPSSALPSAMTSPMHLVGDLTNGVAAADTKSIYTMSGVGVAGAVWYPMALPKGMGSIVAMCGDLVNGLVITDGTNLFAWTYSGSSANEWVPLAQLPLPLPVSDMAGDPTNGVLIALGNGKSPSQLYFGGAGCSCSWVPVTATGTSLPTARVAVQSVCGSYGNGFVLLGESQLFTLSGLKYTAGTTTAVGSCTATLGKVAGTPPFTITDLCGDPTNGITARSGSALIAFAQTPFANWALVNAAAPAPAAAPTAAPTPAPSPAAQAPADAAPEAA